MTWKNVRQRKQKFLGKGLKWDKFAEKDFDFDFLPEL